MPKRARWDGTSPVRVTYPPGAVHPEKEWIVEPNHLLPDDAPATVRDELTSRPDWTEVDQAAPKTTAKDKD